MAGFDLNALMQDPNFVSGLGLLGASSERTKPLLTAYQMLNNMRTQKREDEDARAMREYRQQQIDVARANAEKYGAQTDIAKAKLEQSKKGMEMFERMFGNGGAGGGPMMPQQQPMIAPPPVQEPLGKYGTPQRVLDNLQHVESGGNPLAMGPDIGNGVRAQGAFQFLPSTVKMLGDQGIKFDPFKPQEARDAADFYIQSLVKKNGGDYNKAMAEYGGFKSKDPSSYVGKVLAGSPESQARANSQLQNQQSVQQQALTNFGRYTPEVKLEGDGDMSITMKKDYEPEKIGVDIARLNQQGAQHSETEARLRAQQAEQQRQFGTTETRLNDQFGKTNALAARETLAEEQRTGAQVAKTNQELKVDKAKAQQSTIQYSQTMDRLHDTAQALLEHSGTDKIVGKYNSMLDPRIHPGNDAMNAAALLDTLKAQTFVQGTLAIRQASPTGAGVGNQSNEEGNKLESAVARLNRAQTTTQFKNALKDVMDLSEKSKANVTGVYKNAWGEDLSGNGGGSSLTFGDAEKERRYQEWKAKNGK